MNKTVNHCYNCPFYQSSYDEYSIHGDGFTYKCALNEFLKNDNYFIDDEENSLLEPPEWCPIMNNGGICINFKELPMSNVLEISKYTKQIEKLDNELDDIEDADSEEYITKYESILNLNEKIQRLSNEE